MVCRIRLITSQKLIWNIGRNCVFHNKKFEDVSLTGNWCARFSDGKGILILVNEVCAVVIKSGPSEPDAALEILSSFATGVSSLFCFLVVLTSWGSDTIQENSSSIIICSAYTRYIYIYT